MKSRTDYYRFIDRISFKLLALIFLTLVLGSAIGYWWFDSMGPENGLTQSSADTETVGFSQCLYFSIVTLSSLGYGDFQPVGYSRWLASMEVMIGVVLVGLSVAKLASQLPAEVRELNRRVGGTWLERVRFPDAEGEIFGIISIGRTLDGLSLEFGGNNYERSGEFRGSFHGRLIEPGWPAVKFYYSNSHGSKMFTSGVTEIRFDDIHGPSIVHYTGEVMDIKKNVEYKIEAWRIQDDATLKSLSTPSERHARLVELVRECFPVPERDGE